jgi:hypothetical protein
MSNSQTVGPQDAREARQLIAAWSGAERLANTNARLPSLCERSNANVWIPGSTEPPRHIVPAHHSRRPRHLLIGRNLFPRSIPPPSARRRTKSLRDFVTIFDRPLLTSFL